MGYLKGKSGNGNVRRASRLRVLRGLGTDSTARASRRCSWLSAAPPLQTAICCRARVLEGHLRSIDPLLRAAIASASASAHPRPPGASSLADALQPPLCPVSTSPPLLLDVVVLLLLDEEVLLLDDEVLLLLDEDEELLLDEVLLLDDVELLLLDEEVLLLLLDEEVLLLLDDEELLLLDDEEELLLDEDEELLLLDEEALHTPDSHAPPAQALPSGLCGAEHNPVLAWQDPASWHSSLAEQITGLPPTQAPAAQVSACVHAFPSSQAVPVSGAHVPSTGAPAATEQASHAPASQARSQQTPSAQNPLRHSVGALQPPELF